MQKPMFLSKEEKIIFLRVLYSIFYRDKHINSVEIDVLFVLREFMEIKRDEYKYSPLSEPEKMANEINKIQDVRARIHFMEIIREVYNKELDFFLTTSYASPGKFKQIYKILENNIILTE